MPVHELYPYLRVKNAAQAIDFYKQVFGASEKFRLVEPSGRIGHAELDFAGSALMLSDEFPEYGIRSPTADSNATICIHLHVDNADAIVKAAVAAGAKVVRELQDQFYGERSGTVRDPYGHEWNIGHHIEDVSTLEMQRRYDQMMKGPTSSP